MSATCARALRSSLFANVRRTPSFAAQSSWSPGLAVSQSRGFKANRRTVDVILMEDHPRLGYKGTIVAVRPGYGRNYLVPRGLAVYAIQENRDKFLAKVSQDGEETEDLSNNILKGYYHDLKKRVEKITLVFHRDTDKALKPKGGGPPHLLPVTADLIIKKLWLKRYRLYQLEPEHIVFPEEFTQSGITGYGDHIVVFDMARNALPVGLSPVGLKIAPIALKIQVTPFPVMSEENKEDRNAIQPNIGG